MTLLKKIREKKGLSQRQLAKRAGVAFRTIQLLEKDSSHDARTSTLQKISLALGHESGRLNQNFNDDPSLTLDSVRNVSARILAEGEKSWKIWLFNFVDAFRKNPHYIYIDDAPVPRTSPRIRALLASVVEALCCEKGLKVPWWCDGVGPLSEPWFVSGVENLKAMAIQESPTYFRKRKLFVLNNFLARA